MSGTVFALAVGAFGIGLAEFAMMGLLPSVAHDLHVSIPVAGYLISGYAIGVVVGAPLLTAVSGRLARKHLLLALIALFVLGNLAAALAPSFGFLLAARVLTALPHGAFFGAGAVVASAQSPEGRGARAIALMFTGLTVATIVGVPAAASLGNAVSWRLVFALIAIVGLLAGLAVAVLIPIDHDHTAVHLRTELLAFTRPQVWLTLAIGTLGFSGVFATYAYVAPALTDLTGMGSLGLAAALALFGTGTAVGNLLGGRLADRSVQSAIYLALGTLAVVLALFPITLHNKSAALATIGALGLASGLVIPPIQVRTMRAASEQAPTMAAASVQSCFNVANAAGAALGGVLISAGYGFAAPSTVGALLAAAALGLAALAGRLERAAVAHDWSMHEHQDSQHSRVA